MYYFIHMELLLYDCLGIICNFIKDKDFINFISTSKYFNSLIKYNLKIMTEQHKLSKIIRVKSIYIFTNILCENLNPKYASIPHTITEITFNDKFNGTLDGLCNFKYLTKINIGMHYCKKIFYDNFADTLNKKELAMTIISNKVFANMFNFDIKQLQIYINMYGIRVSDDLKQNCDLCFKLYKNAQMQLVSITKNTINKSMVLLNIINKINKSIDMSNNYESCYHKIFISAVPYDYIKFLEFHIDKILNYLIKIENIISGKSICL